MLSLSVFSRFFLSSYCSSRLRDCEAIFCFFSSIRFMASRKPSRYFAASLELSLQVCASVSDRATCHSPLAPHHGVQTRYPSRGLRRGLDAAYDHHQCPLAIPPAEEVGASSHLSLDPVCWQCNLVWHGPLQLLRQMPGEGAICLFVSSKSIICPSKLAEQVAIGLGVSLLFLFPVSLKLTNLKPLWLYVM
jgi:hypothetical protein